MKGFEEWWNEAKKDDRRYDPFEDEYVARDGWKAALEWVKENLIGDDAEAEYSIDEELKDD